jgi:hypothetical protein
MAQETFAEAWCGPLPASIRFRVLGLALLILPCAAGAQPASAENEPTRAEVRNTVTLEVIPLALLAELGFEYERVISRGWSFYVTPTYWLPFEIPLGPEGDEPVGAPPEKARGQVGSLIVGLRWYLFGDAPRGLFAAASAGYELHHLAYRGRNDVYGVAPLTAQAGYSLVAGDRIVLSVSAGPQYWLPLDAGSPVIDAPDFGARIRISVGGAF